MEKEHQLVIVESELDDRKRAELDKIVEILGRKEKITSRNKRGKILSEHSRSLHWSSRSILTRLTNDPRAPGIVQVLRRVRN